MTFTINNVDMTPYIAAKNGIKWTRNDLEAPNAGRLLNGTMMRGRVAIKMKLEVTCRPLTKSELSTVLNLIKPEFVTVYYDDPQDGVSIRTMYSNNVPATFLVKRSNGEERWTLTFPLVER